MTKAKRRIHGFNFKAETMASGAKTHVALVDKAANQTEALILKSIHTSQTVEVTETDDDGTYTRDTYNLSTSDYGGENVYVTERTVRVVETAVPKITVIT